MNTISNISNQPNILLVGAATRLGQAILKRLVETNWSGKIVVYDNKTGRNMSLFDKYREHITTYYGDISQDADNLTSALKEIDFVIDLHHFPRAKAFKKLQLAEEINVDGTQNLVTAIEKVDNNPLLLYVSSDSVYGDRLSAPMISVTDPVGPSLGDYDAITRIQAEKVIRGTSTEWIIYRPGLTLYPGNSLGGAELFRTPLSTRLEMIYYEDLVSAILNAYEQRNSLWNHTYNVGGGEECRIIYGDFLKRYFAILGMDQVEIPSHCFAERNSIGGYFADSDELNNILKFRKHTLEQFFEEMKKSRTLIKKVGSKLFGSIRGKNLFSQSEPLKAYKTGEKKKMKYFF